MLGLYLQFRKTITDSKHFAYMRRHPSWNIEERRLEEVNKKLAKALSTSDIGNKMKKAWK